VMGRELSKALADADRRGFTYAVIIAPEEAKEDEAILRDMKKREQKAVKTRALVKEIQAQQQQQ